MAVAGHTEASMIDTNEIKKLAREAASEDYLQRVVQAQPGNKEVSRVALANRVEVDDER